jgi:methanethiol oxidase
MAIFRPDSTFYPSPRTAMHAPPEKLAYVVVLNPEGNGRPDALAVMDVNADSSTYMKVVGRVEMPSMGDELHHFGWNACSASLCPYAPHPHIERRYLVVPGLRSSRIHVLDTKPDPTQPHIVKVIEPEELHERTGYSRPHTTHCGPDGIYMPWAPRTGTVRAASSSWTTTPSSRWEGGRWIADRSNSPTTSGGTWAMTP